MPRIYGYVRPAASAAATDTQTQQLIAAGAETIFVEKNTPQARRALRERRRLIDRIEPGDTLVLQSLDRLGTSLEDMLHCFAMLVDRGVGIKVLDAGFESVPDQAHRDLLKLLTGAHSALRSEAIKINVAVARAKGGKKAGSPPTLAPEQWPDIEIRIKTASLETVAGELNVSRQTLWTYRRRMAKQADTATS
jgi:DNA invertase Pin-like site-specific DNA recombinase